MSVEPLTVGATAELSEVMEIFRTHPVRRVPVLDGDSIVGVISVDDLVIDLSTELGNLVRAVSGQVIFGSPEPLPPAPVA